MLLYRSIFLATLLLLAQNSYSACDNKKCTGKISFIFINQDSIKLKMDQDMSKLNCSLSGDMYATLEAQHPYREEIYKTLLAGHISQSPGITIRIAEMSSGCSINYITSQIGQGWQPPAPGGGTGNPPPPDDPPVCLKNPKLPQCKP